MKLPYINTKSHIFIYSGVFCFLILLSIFIPKNFLNDSKIATVFTISNSGVWNSTTTWGTTGGAITIDNPVGIFIATSTGDIFIVNAQDNSLAILNSNNTGQFWSDGFSLYSPRVPGVGLNGKIYITDTGNHRIAILNSDKTFNSFFGGATLYNGVALNDPESLTVASSGDVYISDSNNARIVVTDSNGNFITSYESIGLNIPTGLAFASSGEIYIANQAGQNIVILNPDGTASTTISLGFDAWGIKFDPLGSGKIYVADTTNHLIVILNPDGTVFDTYNGDTFAPLNYPTNFAFGIGGEIYINDHNNDRVVVLNSDGTASTSLVSGIPAPLITGVTHPGINDNVNIAYETVTLNQDESVNNITFTGGGEINLNGYTLNVGGNWTMTNGAIVGTGTVNFVSSTTQYIYGENTFYNLTKTATSTSSLLFDITSTTTVTNNLILTGTSGNTLTIGTIEANLALEYVSQFGTQGSGDGEFTAPYGIEIDSGDNIYVADSGNQRIQKFDSSGNYLSQFGSSTPGSGDGQFDYPTDIDFDSLGNIYVADTNNHRVQKFDSSGNYLSKFGTAGSGNGQFDYPWGIAIDSSDNIYVGDAANQRVQKFDSSGNYLLQFGSYGTGNGQFNYPQNITIDSSDNIYVIEVGNHRIQKFDSSGNYLSQFGSNGSGNGQFVEPYGMAIDSSGYIYVADNGNQRIQKFDSSGNYLSQFGTAGSGNGQFNHPYGLGIDSTDAIYVADGDNNRVQKLTLSTSTNYFNIIKTGSGVSSFEYLDVSNSRNESSEEFSCITSCTDSGSNTNWAFLQPASPSVPAAPSAVGAVSIFIQERIPQEDQVIDTAIEQTPSEIELDENKELSLPVFKRTLIFGSVGEDVRQLQVFLNSNGYLVATDGAGSKGRETIYFGPKTYKALIKFQEDNKKDILEPQGLIKATGVFWDYSRKLINRILGN